MIFKISISPVLKCFLLVFSNVFRPFISVLITFETSKWTFWDVFFWKNLNSMTQF